MKKDFLISDVFLSYIFNFYIFRLFVNALLAKILILMKIIPSYCSVYQLGGVYAYYELT